MQQEFADLILICAAEMDAADKKIIEEAKDQGNVYWRGVTSGPSEAGRLICQKVADDAGMSEMGEPAYLMLAHAWNDILAWADNNSTTST